MSYESQAGAGDERAARDELFDAVALLEDATDVLGLLRRADLITPPEIDLWAALVLGNPPELYINSPGPVSPALALAVARSMAEEMAGVCPDADVAQTIAEAAHFSFRRLDEEVRTSLSDAWHDRATHRGDQLVGIARAAATDDRGLTLDRWRQADEALEVVAWMLGSLCAEERPIPGVIDPISGARTRAFFETTLRHELARGERQITEMSLVVLQLRRSIPLLTFENPPPRLLAETAMVMTDVLRKVDVVARLDSRTMAALLPATGPRNGLIAAGRLGERLKGDATMRGWSVDVGVSGIGVDALGPSELLAQARRAMRAAGQGAARHPYVFV